MKREKNTDCGPSWHRKSFAPQEMSPRKTPCARPAPGPQIGVEGDTAGGFREEGHRLAEGFQDHLAMIRDPTTVQPGEGNTVDMPGTLSNYEVSNVQSFPILLHVDLGRKQY